MMTIVKIRTFTPEVRLVQLLVPRDILRCCGHVSERIEDAERRLVDHRGGEDAIEEIELGIVVMTGQVPTLHTIELAVAQDKLHLLGITAIVPDGGRALGLVER